MKTASISHSDPTIPTVVRTMDGQYVRQIDGTVFLNHPDTDQEDVVRMLRHGFCFELSPRDSAGLDLTLTPGIPAELVPLLQHAFKTPCGITIAFDPATTTAWLQFFHPELLVQCSQAAQRRA